MYQSNYWWGLKNNGRQHSLHGRDKWNLKNSEARKQGHNQERGGLQSAYSNRVGEGALRGPRYGGDSWTMSAGQS